MRHWVLIGPSFAQVRWIQYASKSQLVSLYLGEPLGRRDVAVEAGDDEPHRVAVLERKLAAVKAEGDKASRPSSAISVLKPAVKPSTLRPTSCLLERVILSRATPPRRAHRRAIPPSSVRWRRARHRPRSRRTRA